MFINYEPLNTHQINVQAGTYSPSAIKPYNNKAFIFWQRALFQRACSTLKFTLPEEWQGNIRDFFYFCLYRYGYVSIFNSDKFGMSFQPCTLSGYNLYYQPTDVLISNPALKDPLRLKIGVECELLKLTPDYMGIWDIVSYYAEKLALLDNAINISLINIKIGYIIGAKSKAAAKVLKKALDLINKGNPAVVYDSYILNDRNDSAPTFEAAPLPSPKDLYLTEDQLRDFQTILNDFDCEIGIPTIPYQKRERMVNSEAQSRVIDATSRSLVWYDCIQSSIAKIKQLYPNIRLSCELRYDPDKIQEVAGNVNS